MLAGVTPVDCPSFHFPDLQPDAREGGYKIKQALSLVFEWDSSPSFLLILSLYVSRQFLDPSSPSVFVLSSHQLDFSLG